MRRRLNAAANHGSARSQPAKTQLHRVLGRGSGAGAAGWGPPFQDAGFGLLEPPAQGLLAPVVVSAKGGEVAGAGRAAVVPGGGVVQVAAGGGLPAAGRGAPGVPGGDQVPQRAAGPVAVLGLLAVARVLLDAGADPNGGTAGGRPGWTPLRCAVAGAANPPITG